VIILNNIIRNNPFPFNLDRSVSMVSNIDLLIQMWNGQFDMAAWGEPEDRPGDERRKARLLKAAFMIVALKDLSGGMNRD
jgi:hypothetical protein